MQRPYAIAGERRRSKYGNRKTVVDGIEFDSAKEAARYSTLKLLERAGEIKGLQVQPVFPLDVNGVPVARYVADFSYVEKGRRVVEDVKSAATRRLPVYRLKVNLLKALTGIEVVEV